MRQRVQRFLERSFADCLETNITLFGGTKTLSGWDSVVQYFNESYFHQTLAALDIGETAFHPLDEAMWYEYEFAVQSMYDLFARSGIGAVLQIQRTMAGGWHAACG